MKEECRVSRNQNIARYEFETEQIALNNKSKEKAADEEKKRVENQNKINEGAAKDEKNKREKGSCRTKKATRKEAERRQAEYARKVMRLKRGFMSQRVERKRKKKNTSYKKAFDAKG